MGSVLKDHATNEHVYSYEEAVMKFGMGRYQVFIGVVTMVSIWCLATMNEGFIYIGAEMAHTCITPEINDTYANGNLSELYVVAEDQCSYSRVDMLTNETVESSIPCTKWSYDTTYFDSTVASEWNMNKCNGIWKVSVAISISLLGLLAGCYLFGYLADRFGRMKIFLACSIGITLSGIAATFSSSLTMLTALRFTYGMFTAGLRNSGFVYFSELVTPKWRSANGSGGGFCYWMSSILLATSAMYVRNWRMLQLLCALSCAVFIPFYWFVHESPQWLLVHGREKEAINYFRRSAKINKIPIPDDFEVHISSKKEDSKVNYLDFVNTKQTLRVSLAIWGVWLLNALNTNGFTFNVGNISGNFFINFYTLRCVGWMVVFSGFALNYSRIKCLLLTQFAIALLIGVLSIVISVERFNGIEYVITALSSVGGTLTQFAWAAVYVLSAELYVTSMRVSALSIGSSASRIGAALGPLVALASQKGVYVPYVIITFSAALSGALALLIPETKSKPLLHSIEDMRAFHKMNIRACKTRSASLSYEEDGLCRSGNDEVKLGENPDK